MPARLKPYLHSLPNIIKYQILTKALLAAWMLIMRWIFYSLLKSAGKVAVSSGDFTFLFTTWQGILILLVGLISLFIYVAFDLNSKIVLCHELLTEESVSVKNSIKEGFLSIRGLINVRGIVVILYIALIAPILGFGFSISLTEGLRIPTFIASFIAGSPLYETLAVIVVLIFLSVGIANLYILHCIVIDSLPIKEAGAESKRLIRENWKDYLNQNILFILVMALILTAVIAVGLILPLWLVDIIPFPDGVRRVLTLVIILSGGIMSTLADLSATPLYIMKMTQLFYTYKQGVTFVYKEREKREHPHIKTAIGLVSVVVIVSIFVMYRNFDTLFPAESSVNIIAHRGGGNEDAENTVSGLLTAWEEGAYGSEIDIQRTKDGYYILNHDGTFKRVAGEKRKPGDMTLEEIKSLNVDGEQIPTFEEVLEASKGKVVLFTELKGKSADTKMADDAVKLIRQYGMEEECVLISLKYDLIDYIESKYPEIQTGFLTFVTFGDTAALNCDYLGLEEESATAGNISSIHRNGKKALAWTVNDPESQKHFLCTAVDGIITDNIIQAQELKKELAGRSDRDRIIDRILGIMD